MFQPFDDDLIRFFKIAILLILIRFFQTFLCKRNIRIFDIFEDNILGGKRAIFTGRYNGDKTPHPAGQTVHIIHRTIRLDLRSIGYIAGGIRMHRAGKPPVKHNIVRTVFLTILRQVIQSTVVHDIHKLFHRTADRFHAELGLHYNVCPRICHQNRR